jgi:multidrug efflux pump
MPPVYSKVNPADAPILTLAITSPSLPLIRVQRPGGNRLAQKISQVSGVGWWHCGRAAPGVRIQANPTALAAWASRWTTCARHHRANVNRPRAALTGPRALHHRRQRPAAVGRRIPRPHRGLQERRPCA